MTSLDPVLLSVYARTFKAITDEMSISVGKTTRSPILCEAKDFVTGVYDARGQMLEQTEHLPILAFSLAPVCRYIVDYLGDEIYPGDVIFHNDVFSLGNQNNDVAVYTPVFFEDRLVAWTAVKGHQADIGGAVAGGYNPNAVEVWQEALRIPPVKVYEKGRLRQDVWNLIFANIRFDIVEHDLRAQMGAGRVGERRMLALLNKYGLASFETHKDALFDATARIMEAEIAGIPSGTYHGEGYVFYDGRNVGTTFTIRVAIEVRGDRIKFDYSGTDAQTNGFVNGTYASSASATLLTFLQMVNPRIPHNEGMIRPIEIVIPEGTILNASYPKATTFGNHLCPPNADAIVRALAPVLPDRVTAGWNHLLCSLTTALDPRNGEKYVDIGFMGLKGGSGAMRGTDGYDHIGMIDASGGVLDQDYEMFEQQTPHRLIKHEYLCDSAGAGQWRGGLGVETVLEIGSDDTQVVVFGDGDVVAPFGLAGGGPGTLNSIMLTYPDGTTVVPRNKDLIGGVPRGTLYRQEAGGGGGYGDPALRERAMLIRDVQNGVVSLRSAREIYRLEGVVSMPETPGVESITVAGDARHAAGAGGAAHAGGAAGPAGEALDLASQKMTLLSNIMRAAHFEWRRAALAAGCPLEPVELVKQYWTEVGHDTAKFYLKKIDAGGDIAKQVANLFVQSSVAMNEDAELLEQDANGCSRARHVACPWYDWHKRENLLEEDQAGCDQWLATVVDDINAALGTKLRFETVETLPGGAGQCLRKFWVER